MKPSLSRLALIVAFLASVASCDQREKIFDFVANPVLPPISSVEPGTYDRTFRTYLDRGDNSDSKIYFTYDPDIPFTEMDKWTDYYASVQNGFDIVASSSMRVFAYASPTRFSKVATLAWELKCPQAYFNYPPGPISSYATIQIWSPGDPAFAMYYTADGSDPRNSPTRRGPFSGGAGEACATLDGVAANARILSVTQRPGWSDSNILDAPFYIDYQSAGITFVLNLPDGTVVGFSGQAPVLSASQSMTVSASPAGMSSYRWTLNGQIVCLGGNPADPYPGSSLRLGNYSPAPSPAVNAGSYDLSSLAAGSYTLSCIVTDSRGYAYSKSISFSVY